MIVFPDHHDIDNEKEIAELLPILPAASVDELEEMLEIEQQLLGMLHRGRKRKRKIEPSEEYNYPPKKVKKQELPLRKRKWDKSGSQDWAFESIQNMLDAIGTMDSLKKRLKLVNGIQQLDKRAESEVDEIFKSHVRLVRDNEKLRLHIIESNHLRLTEKLKCDYEDGISNKQLELERIWDETRLAQEELRRETKKFQEEEKMWEKRRLKKSQRSEKVLEDMRREKGVLEKQLHKQKKKFEIWKARSKKVAEQEAALKKKQKWVEQITAELATQLEENRKLEYENKLLGTRIRELVRRNKEAFSDYEEMKLEHEKWEKDEQQNFQKTVRQLRTELKAEEKKRASKISQLNALKTESEECSEVDKVYRVCPDLFADRILALDSS